MFILLAFAGLLFVLLVLKADEGFAASITFQSGFCAQITSVDFGGVDRKALDTSHDGTTNGWMTYIPSDLKDMGELTVELLFNPSTNWKTAMTAAAETATVTFPVPAGLSTGATVACSAFATNFKPRAPHDAIMTATLTIKFSGEPTLTAAA